MTKNEILDYVMNTPDNTNRMVLSDMLDEFSSSGGGGGGLVVHSTDEEAGIVLDKTWQEIYDAFSAGKVVVFAAAEESDFMMRELILDATFDPVNGYSVMTSASGNVYKCASASDYPTMPW